MAIDALVIPLPPLKTAWFGPTYQEHMVHNSPQYRAQMDLDQHLQLTVQNPVEQHQKYLIPIVLFPDEQKSSLHLLVQFLGKLLMKSLAALVLKPDGPLLNIPRQSVSQLDGPLMKFQALMVLVSVEPQTMVQFLLLDHPDVQLKKFLCLMFLYPGGSMMKLLSPKV